MKQLRERLNLRTVDVASRLGIGESTVRNWEHGRAVPRFEHIRPLMDLYGVSFDDVELAVKLSKSDPDDQVVSA